MESHGQRNGAGRGQLTGVALAMDSAFDQALLAGAGLYLSALIFAAWAKPARETA